MNLYLRLLLMFLLARFKRRASLFEASRSRHRVWLNDVDLLGHMNNGRYFTITDYVRIELLIRAGIWQAMKRRGVYPVMAGETIQFRRPLKPLQRYEICTRMVGWDERFFYVEHRFVRGEALHALALVKVRVIGQGRPRPAEVLRHGYRDVPEVHLTPLVEEWNASTEAHWAEARAAA